MKYHAVLNFGYGQKPLKFTAINLEALTKRFAKECLAEQERLTAQKDYVFVKPNLTVEVK